MRTRRSVLIAGLLLALLTCLGVLHAQSGVGRIEGVVTDGQGSPLPGVTVTLVLPAGARNATTDARGVYQFAGVAPGWWKVRLELSGFGSVEREVRVFANQVTRFDSALRISQVEETVTVTADTPYVRAPRGRDTERYAHAPANPVTRVQQDPRSTFSIDVDTASYANVRRFLLDEHRLPPADAVRVEEMVNYFEYDYAPPQGAAPFAITTELGPCPWNRDRKLALVGLQARRIELDQAPPLNLVFLVDVSGSMQDPRKLPLVKESLRLLVEDLRPQDRVGLVVYAGASGLVLEATPADRKAQILSAIDRLSAGGSTNGGAGIQLAYATAEAARREGGINRVVLATDGDFNVGVTSTDELVRLVEAKRATGIGLSVLGFGMGNLRDELLEQLADKGDGNYGYVDTLAEARKVLRQQAAGTLVTLARDVKIQVEFNPARVRSFRLVGYENRRLEHRDFRDDLKDAGDLGAGHNVTALYEIEPQPGARDDDLPPLRYQPAAPRAPRIGDEWLLVRARWKPAASGAAQETEIPLLAGGGSASDSFRFAGAVAGFGLLLRDPEAGSADFARVAEEARGALGRDPHGWRAEMVQLAEEAMRLARSPVASR